MKEKVIFNWSGGKDSALALYKILQSEKYDIECLLTSINYQFQRISMHGVRVELLEKQAESLGFPLVKLQIPEFPDMATYNQLMTEILMGLISKGAVASVFGDIFLEDLRQYREENLSKINLHALFPLWKIPTDRLIREFIDSGFKTIVTCVNEKYLDKSFAGRIIDNDFLKDLPSNVDPCGENGEFHTFVFEGPIFKTPITFVTGETVYKKYTSAKPENDAGNGFKSNANSKVENPFDYGFWFCDLLPVSV